MVDVVKCDMNTGLGLLDPDTINALYFFLNFFLSVAC